MVGLKASADIPAGSCILSPIPPLAASLSDALLSTHCSSCFAPLPPHNAFACHGRCLQTTAYCSLTCRERDLDLHSKSGECCLLALLSPSSSHHHSHDARNWAELWHGSKSFPALGGSCDLRSALRLLTCYSSRTDNLTKNKRLGGLMSNRSILVHPESAMDSDLLDLSQQIEEAALLICLARHLRSRSSLVLTPKNICKQELLSAQEALCQVVTNGVQVQFNHKAKENDVLAMDIGSCELGTAFMALPSPGLTIVAAQILALALFWWILILNPHNYQ